MGKAELVVQDFGGEHSKSMGATRSRLLKGGSWKKQRTIIILPSADSIPAKVALSHWNLIFPPNQPVLRMLALGMEVGEAYSEALTNILAHPELNQWEYVLTLEHDNAPPPDGLLKLLARLEERKDLAAVGGLYFTKGEGGVAQIWGDPADPILNFRPQPPAEGGGLVECVGTGMGFTLFRLEMFKDERLRRPWFQTQKSASGVGTQDLAFWADARKFGYRAAIDCDVRVGHFDLSNDIMW